MKLKSLSKVMSQIFLLGVLFSLFLSIPGELPGQIQISGHNNALPPIKNIKKQNKRSQLFIVMIDSDLADIGKYKQEKEFKNVKLICDLIAKALKFNPYSIFKGQSNHDEFDPQKFYKTFSEDEDIVSFVLYRIPSSKKENEAKVLSQFLFTNKEFGIHNKIFNKDILLKFLDNSNKFLKVSFLPTPAKNYAHKLVLPFLSQFLKNDKISETIERIILLSISDSEVVDSSIGNIIKRNTDASNWLDYAEDFNFDSVTNENVSADDISSKKYFYLENPEADFTHTKLKKGKINHVEFILVGSNLESNKLDTKIIDNIELERAWITSNSKIELWRGEVNISFDRGNCFLEWAKKTKNNEGLIWNPVKIEITEKDSVKTLKENEGAVVLCISEKKQKDGKYVLFIRDLKKENFSELNLYFRILSKNYNFALKKNNEDKEIKETNLQLPFLYTPVIKYVDAHFNFMPLPQFIAELKEDNRNVNDRISKILKSFKITAPILLGTEAEEFDKKLVSNEEYQKRRLILISLFLFLLSTFLIQIAWRKFRKPIISALPIKETGKKNPEKFVIDFNTKMSEIHLLMALQFINKTKRRFKKQRRKPFNLQLVLNFEFPPMTEDSDAQSTPELGDFLKPQFDQKKLLKVIHNNAEGNESEAKMQCIDNQYIFMLNEIRAGDKKHEGDQIQIYFDSAAVTDLLAEIKQNTFVNLRLEWKMDIMETTDSPSNRKSVRLLPGYKTGVKDFNVTFKPEMPQYDIEIKPLLEIGNEEEENRVHNHIIIPYSTLSPTSALFEVIIRNKCSHAFSKPINDSLSLTANEGPTSITNSSIFKLARIDSHTGNMSHSLKKDEFSVYHIGLDFPDLGHNPVEDRHFNVFLKYDDSTWKETINVTVVSSEEKTGALLRLDLNNGNTLKPQGEYHHLLKEETFLMIDDVGQKNLKLEYHFPDNDESRIRFDMIHPMQLFSIILKNSCITGTGGYKVNVNTASIVLQPVVEKEESNAKGSEGETTELIINEKNYGEFIHIDYSDENDDHWVNDNRESELRLRFVLDPVSVLARTYKSDFSVHFQLKLNYYDRGESLGITDTFTVDCEIHVKGLHHVTDHYLVVDFGTTAITVENVDPDKNIHTIALQSPKGAIKSEDGLLPSTINYNKNTNDSYHQIGDADFVRLPAVSSVVDADPHLVLNGLKLQVLKGNGRLKFPKKFVYKNEYSVICRGKNATNQMCSEPFDGNECKRFDRKRQTCIDDGICLEKLMFSVYRNFKEYYLSDSSKQYYKWIENHKHLIFTHPNLYNERHKNFIKDIIYDVFNRDAIDDELEETLGKKRNESIYKENIHLVSESEAALYSYLDLTAGKRRLESSHIMIVDVGGGTMDISLANVKYTDPCCMKPESIFFKRKDGVTLAGEALDKAIALQAHEILDQYSCKDASELKINDQSETDTKTKDTHQINNDNNMVQVVEALTVPLGNQELEDILDNTVPAKPLPHGMIKEMKVENSLPQTNLDFKPGVDGKKEVPLVYNLRIVGSQNGQNTKNELYEKTNSKTKLTMQVEVMWKFKDKHIFNFKKRLGEALDDEYVPLCLGKNDSTNGICYLALSKLKFNYEDNGGVGFDCEIRKSADSQVELCLKRKDWLELPFIKRFQTLVEEKINSFLVDANWPEERRDDLEIALSGRTALWPPVKIALEKLNLNPFFVYSNLSAQSSRGNQLKRAVAQGAYRMVVLWNKVNYVACDIVGSPAIEYMKRNNDSKVKLEKLILEVDTVTSISLIESPSFKLGLKTAMDFISFSEFPFPTSLFCRNNDHDKHIAIEVKKLNSKNSIPWKFYINNQLVTFDLKKQDMPIMKSGNVLWPTMTPQLPPVKVEDFDENY
jgi:hypothetical protein